MKNELPLIVARGFVVLPETEVTFTLAREKSIKALQLALIDETSKDKELIITTQFNPKVDEPTLKDIYPIGTKVRIKKAVENKTAKEWKVTVVGKRAVNLALPENGEAQIPLTINFELRDVEKFTDLERETINKQIMDIIDYANNNQLEADSKYLKEVNNELSKTKINYEKAVHNIALTYIHNSKGTNFTAIQDILESVSILGKLKDIQDAIFSKSGDETIKQEVDDTISKKLNDNLNKQQREFYLRERLRIVKEELGEISNRDDDVENIKKKLAKFPYPKNIKEKIASELSKYELALNSNEAGITKAYIDWLLDLPWWQESVDNNDLLAVQETLDKNHYGITKVKQRIIEYLAVKMQNPKSKSPIICLVGPPGVGKTSLAKSIAEALNKVFIKVSLGGVRDEAEIRGHRKTYLGAMPGRIIKGMKKAGVTNPLFLLDEIDKMGSDHKGDPASAMLEVLDPEQNDKFSDNYIEEDYDLSNVMFVATANYFNQIPYALTDRLEIIELSSYTANEKKEIAKVHLIKKVLETSKLTSKDIKFTDEAIDHIINYYTREAGVRELERMIQQIVRKYLVDKLTSKEKESSATVIVDEALVEKYLGKKKFDLTLKEKQEIPGIVNGMAYTAAGGDLLPIEATYFKGKGNIVITGNLEQTMKESVSVALGYVKANAKHFGINEDIFKDIDIHIHVPAGGIPKDGPSAGVTLTTAIISSLTNIPVSTSISMTGEIMLRGKVGIIGGVKEKTISAYRAGIREIFLPKDDERFLEDVPADILSDIKIHLVTKYQEIYDALFKNVKPIALTESNKDLYLSFSK